MKHLSQDKYTIAWFRLAECVSRGEKERAFGVYRLLSHSIDNDAFVLQLQGDLYFSFDDVESAIAKYADAAHLYENEERYLEAAAVYENLLSLQPDAQQHRDRLIILYQRLHIPSKELEHRMILIEERMKEHDFKDAQVRLMDLDVAVDPATVAQLSERFIVDAIAQQELAPEQIENQIQKLMTLFLTYDLHKHMRRFLVQLQSIDSHWYKIASKALKE